MLPEKLVLVKLYGAEFRAPGESFSLRGVGAMSRALLNCSADSGAARSSGLAAPRPLGQKRHLATEQGRFLTAAHRATSLREFVLQQSRSTGCDCRTSTGRTHGSCVCGKGRQQTRLSLSREVGGAIVANLQRGRPAAGTDALFLRTRAPLGALRSHRAVSVLVDRCYDLRRFRLNIPNYSVGPAK